MERDDPTLYRSWIGFTRGDAPLDEATNALMLSRLSYEGFSELTLPFYLGLREEYVRMYENRNRTEKR
jgi:hypothetical protein